MSLENGELAQRFVEITKNYRAKEAALAEDMKARYQSESDEFEQKQQKERKALQDRQAGELDRAKKNLQDGYLAEIVGTVFGTYEEPLEAPVENGKLRCPGCDAEIVDADAKFCSNCAYPLEEKVNEKTPVPSAGRVGRQRRR